MSDLIETAIGMLPRTWGLISAEKFCIKVADGTHDSPKEVPHGKPLITSRHLKEGYLDFDNSYNISDEDFAEINKRSKVDQWDVIFSMIGTVGEVYLEKTQNPAYAVKNVGIFKAGDEIKGKWLYYYLKSPAAINHIEASKAGTTQGYITLGALRKFPIPVPSTAKEMKEIVGVLDSIQNKIELNRKMTMTMESMAWAIFKSWFVDFDPVRAKTAGKPIGLPKEISDLFPARLIDSELGEIPEGWSVGCLSDLINIEIGGDWGGDCQEEGLVEAVVLRGTDLADLQVLGSVYRAPRRWIKENSITKRKIREGDILIGGSGLGPIGKSILFHRSIYNMLDLPVIYSNFCKRFSVNESDPIFAAYPACVLELLYKSKVMSQYFIGTSVPNLNAAALLKHQILIPSLTVSKVFGEFYFNVLAKRYDAENKTLMVLRDCLLPKLLSGELRLS